jgi:hypothetical protein
LVFLLASAVWAGGGCVNSSKKRNSQKERDRSLFQAGLWVAIATILTVIATLFEIIPLQIILITGAVVCIIMAIYKLGGLPCKERTKSKFKICTRCTGIYSGLVASIISTLAIASHYEGLPRFSTLIGIFLIIVSVILLLPTLIQGGIRRIKGETVLDSKFLLFLFGLFMGLSLLPFCLSIKSLF